MKKFLGLSCILFFAVPASAQDTLFLNRSFSQNLPTTSRTTLPQTPSETFEDTFQSVLDTTELDLLDTQDDRLSRDISRSKYLLEREVLSEEDEQRFGKNLFVLHSRDLIEKNMKDGVIGDAYKAFKKGFSKIKKYTSLSIVENESGKIDTETVYSTKKNSKTHLKVHLEPTIRDGMRVTAKTSKFLRLDVYPTRQRAVVRIDFDF